MEIFSYVFPGYLIFPIYFSLPSFPFSNLRFYVKSSWFYFLFNICFFLLILLSSCWLTFHFLLSPDKVNSSEFCSGLLICLSIRSGFSFFYYAGIFPKPAYYTAVHHITTAAPLILMDLKVCLFQSSPKSGYSAQTLPAQFKANSQASTFHRLLGQIAE